MGGGAAAGAEELAVEIAAQFRGLEATDLVAFRCWWPGCRENPKNGATRAWIATHLNNHREIQESERKAQAAKVAEAAKRQAAAGPSRIRRQNKREQDLAASQRKDTKKKGGEGKKKSRGRDNGKGKADPAKADGKRGGGRRNANN